MGATPAGEIGLAVTQIPFPVCSFCFQAMAADAYAAATKRAIDQGGLVTV
jgi:hypothetical protein